MNNYVLLRSRPYMCLFSILASFLLVSCEKEFVEKDSPQANAITMAKKGGGTTKNPLFVPAVVSPEGFILRAAPGAVNLGDGKNTSVWAYNGTLPGPTFKANRGSRATISYKNDLPTHSITHWHGMLVNTMNDGQPQQAIHTGETYAYDFIINQRAAFNWYHPHPHMHTGSQVYNGLAGGFIVNDAEEAGKNLPSGKYEVPLVIRDAAFDRNGNLLYKPTSGGFFGNVMLVNGTKDPYLEVDKAVYRFRVLNGANSRIFGLALTDGSANEIKMHLIGNDGGLLPVSSDHTRIDISNGERIDILVDFRAFPAGSKIMLRDLRSGLELMEFRVNASAPVAFMATLPLTSEVEVLANPVVTRHFSFDGMTKINGKVYDESRIDWTVKKGETELWLLKTNGNAPHPVHIHGASFQVVSRTGGRGQLYTWETGWKDTVLLENGETVSILIRFDAYAGRYLMHCHKLEHEDQGMMANFEVVE